MGRNYPAVAKSQRLHRQRNRENLWNYLLTHPCVDCGETDPRVLDFDHVRDTKKFGISRAVAGSHRSWNTILTEIAKCDVRCANDHRRRTAERGGFYLQFDLPSSFSG